ncbi:MAG: BlaI/MecI/CopY family transcriptional regulator [Eubacteriales bacterium]|nr:BlaI/MecI/CopY family transcriptional regulator [Eubacteriales bacterium]
MDTYKLCDSEYRFMTILWDNAPIPSGVLVKKCNEELGWKKSTTYTVIKKLAGKGYLKNENAIVSVLVGRELVQRDESNYFVERTFSGSLPGFLTAFLGGKKISKEEAEEIRQIIDAYSEK